MELEFSYRALRKIVERYYLKNENLRVKFGYELKRVNYGYYADYFIVYKNNINGIKSIGTHRLSNNDIENILNDYLEPQGYNVRYSEPIISDHTFFNENDYHLAGMKLICSKKETYAKTLKGTNKKR